MFLRTEKQAVFSNKEKQTKDHGNLQQKGHPYIITGEGSV